VEKNEQNLKVHCILLIKSITKFSYPWQ